MIFIFQVTSPHSPDFSHKFEHALATDFSLVEQHDLSVKEPDL